METRTPGPSDETLGKLFGMLPSMGQGIDEGKFCAPATNCDKICIACLTPFGRRRAIPAPPKRDVCKKCRKHLVSGGTIFICPDPRVVMVKAKDESSAMINPKYRGRVVHVPVDYMDRLMPRGGPAAPTTAKDAGGPQSG